MLETLKKNDEFKAVYKRGRSYVGAYLVLYTMPRTDQDAKLGITVSKKVGKAVTRNRVRRLVKETFRRNEMKVPKAYDYVVVARVRANQANYHDIEKNLLYLLRQMKKES